jgi:hypothetical protein
MLHPIGRLSSASTRGDEMRPQTSCRMPAASLASSMSILVGEIPRAMDRVPRRVRRDRRDGCPGRLKTTMAGAFDAHKTLFIAIATRIASARAVRAPWLGCCRPVLIDNSFKPRPERDANFRVSSTLGASTALRRARGLNFIFFSILNRAGSNVRQVCRGLSHPKISQTALGAV